MNLLKFRRPHFTYDGKFYGFTYWGPVEGGFNGPSHVNGCSHKQDQQYIGLADKNGLMIYEGDKLKFQGKNWLDEHLKEHLGIVEWNEELLKWDVVVNGDPVPDLKKSYDDNEFEVVGNIYHQELETV